MLKNMTNNQFKEKILFWLPQTLSGLIGCLSAVVAFLFDSLGLNKLIENQSPLPFAKLSLCLLALLLWLLAFYLLKRPRYKFLPELGIRGNIKKRHYLCPSCDKLLRVEPDGFRCIPCDKFIPLPSKEIMQLIYGNKN